MREKCLEQVVLAQMFSCWESCVACYRFSQQTILAFLIGTSHFVVSLNRLGQACNHIAALLFYIEHHCSSKEDTLPTELTKTSMPMKWNQAPRKIVQPTFVSNIQFSKPSHGSKSAAACDAPASTRLSRSKLDPRHEDDRVLVDASRERLLQAVCTSMPDSGMKQFWNPSPYPQVEGNLPTAPDGESQVWKKLVIFCHDNARQVDPSQFLTPSAEQCFELMETMVLSADEVQEVERITRGQASSKLWLALHHGRITSSRFGTASANASFNMNS